MCHKTLEGFSTARISNNNSHKINLLTIKIITLRLNLLFN